MLARAGGEEIPRNTGQCVRRLCGSASHRNHTDKQLIKAMAAINRAEKMPRTTRIVRVDIPQRLQVDTTLQYIASCHQRQGEGMTTGAGIHYVIRDGAESDNGFIASSYVSTARMSMPRGQLNRMPEGAFNAWHYRYVGKLLESCDVKVAVPDVSSAQIYGYSLTDSKQVHMVYVSKSHWRLGIGKALLNGITISDAIFRLWPNTMHGSATEWLWPHIEKMTFLPYWIED